MNLEFPRTGTLRLAAPGGARFARCPASRSQLGRVALVVLMAFAFSTSCSDETSPVDGGSDAGVTENDSGTTTGSDFTGAECAPLTVETDSMGDGDCVLTQSDDDLGITTSAVRADCTDENIRALLGKRHIVMVPDDVTRPELWLHFGGTGGQPTNTTNLGIAAATAGYRYISIAYPNEPSISDRCTCAEGPRPIECEGVVRAEVLYGADVTPWFDMVPQEAIVSRLVALLEYMAAEQPNAGWDAYLADGEPVWGSIAVSGFSQGGGMAGMIARDHLVARALYLSKGGGSASNVMLDPPAAQPCMSHEECTKGRCCPATDPACDDTPETGGFCTFQQPVPWIYEGADTDGDGRGDGTADTRTTPPDRQFALVHREEGAWEYSPEVFDAWGMGSRDDFFDADTGEMPPAGTRLFSTALPPRNDCSEHQSMGPNGCQPIDPNTGRPAMARVWLWAMTSTVDE